MFKKIGKILAAYVFPGLLGIASLITFIFLFYLLPKYPHLKTFYDTWIKLSFAHAITLLILGTLIPIIYHYIETVLPQINDKLNLLDSRFRSSEPIYQIGRRLSEMMSRRPMEVGEFDEITYKVGKALQEIFEQNGMMIPNQVNRVEECVKNSTKYTAISKAGVYRWYHYDLVEFLIIQFIYSILYKGEYKRYYVYNEEEIMTTYKKEMHSILFGIHNRIVDINGTNDITWPASVFDLQKLKEYMEDQFRWTSVCGKIRKKSPIKNPKTNKREKIPSCALWVDQSNHSNAIIFWGNHSEFYNYNEAFGDEGELIDEDKANVIKYCESLMDFLPECENTQIDFSEKVKG